MATITTPAVTAPRRRWIFRIVVFGVVLLLLVIVGVIAWCYSIARAALPQLDGRLAVRGLSAPVTVTRDSHGLPTIDASSLEDLFFAQGYVTAQDRLWQMDVIRRFAAGEMSELLGADLLKHDRKQRILGLRAASKRAEQSLSRRDRNYFEAYTRGVNAFIESHGKALPIEFRILRYTPRPWTVEDCMLMGARMVQDLNHGTFERALEKEKILAKLGPELTADLYINSSWRDRPPSAKAARIDQQNPDGDDEDDEEDKQDNGGAVAKALFGSAPFVGTSPFGNANQTEDPVLVPGSNNWVVSGQHTVTGKPLLSNDMHLGHQMPNLWYAVHLRSGSFDVTGVVVPGMPFVIVGHNRRIAWGFTNVGPTVEDVYVENFNAAGQYQTPEGWRAPEHRTEVIHVKGKPNVNVDVVITRHGPIISDLLPGESRKLALRWTLYDSLNDPFFDVDSAQNWTDFLKALSPWDTPSQNAVYADADGHIGYQATGHIPIRAAGDGSLPVSGADNQHEWTGYVPFEKLPRVSDPPSGILATANGRITPNGYSHNLSTEWGSPWRTERIYRVLDSGKKFAPPDMLALETDIYSAFDRLCAERFVYALDHAKKVSARAAQAREMLRDWDGRLTAESAAATVENRARFELVRLLLEPKLGADSRTAKEGDSEEEELTWKQYRWFMSSIWLENVLQKQPKRWLPSNYESYDALLATAVETAVTGPEAPKDLSQWTWGKFSPIDIEHPILSRLPIVGKWSGPGLQEQSGGGYTVKQVGRTFGPSERFTANLADLDQSTLNLVTGEGGNFLSPYYMDQWKAWYEGFTFPLPFSKEAVEKAKSHQLVLQPDTK
jgi:penicillin G amidase